MLELPKRTKRVFTLLLFAFLLIGCQDTDSPPETPHQPVETPAVHNTYVSSFKKINSPVHYVYMTENPLITETISKDPIEGFGESYVQIRGLKDTDHQKKINETIKTFHENSRNLTIPPYRGIKRVLTEDYVLKEQFVNTYVTFSFNNLLSLVSNVNLIYSNGLPSKDLYMDYTDTLTLDLATGKTLHLEDLFVNDADYKITLNNYIRRFLDKEFAYDEYQEWFGTTELVAPFKGIRENPKFFLSYNTLVFLLDAETPEFNTQYNTRYLNIPFLELKELLAIKERFSEGIKDLYTDESTPNVTMISSYDKYVTGKSYQEKRNGVDYYVHYRYPPSMPQLVIEDFLKNLNPEETPPENIKTIYKEGSIGYTGEFISASIDMNYSNNEDYFIFRNFFRIYTSEGQIITLEKLFQKEFDYKPMIMNTLKSSISNEQKKFSPVLEDLYDSLMFRISGDGLYFTTNPIQSSEREFYPVQFGIPFKEIGLENLTLFDH